MIVEHREAVEALLTGRTVYHGRSPNSAPLPYVVQHTSVKAASASSIAAESDWREWRVVTQCVAANAETADILYDLVEGALLDAKPVVAGRSSSPLVIETARSSTPDEDVQPPSFTATIVWTFTTVPA